MHHKYTDTFFIVLIIGLSGCGTCSITTFNKLSSDQTEGTRVRSDGPRHVVIRPVQDVKLDMGTCHSWSNSFCAVITMPEERRMKFSSNEFLEINVENGELIQTHLAEFIRYFRECRERQSGETACNSTARSPTTAPVEIQNRHDVEYDDGETLHMHWLKFPVSSEFIGARETKGPFSVLREYEMPIILDMGLMDQARIIRLPEIRIDGRPYRLPDIRITKVNEELCTHTAW